MTRKALNAGLVLTLLGILLLAVMLGTKQADASDPLPPELKTTIIETLSRSPFHPAQDEVWDILNSNIVDDWALALGILINEKEEGIFSSDVIYVIARRESSGLWRAVSNYDEQWLEWVQAAPDSLLSEEFKSYFVQKAQQAVISPQATVIYRFPWMCNQKARVSQGHHDGKAIDFVLYGTDVTAATTGEVVWAEWRKEVTCEYNKDKKKWYYPKSRRECGWKDELNYVLIRDANNKITAYLHLAHNSIPPEFAKNYSIEPPVPVNSGKKIGQQGATGLSTGNHLHFSLGTSQAWGVYGITFDNGPDEIPSSQLKPENPIKKWVSYNCSGSDPIAPKTELTATPPSCASENPIVFTWTGSDNRTSPANIRYGYRLDNYDHSHWSKWTKNTSVAYPNLSNGRYTFRIYAIDEAYNEEYPEIVYDFKVDTKPPDNPTSIQSNCQNNHWQNSCNHPQFTWTSPISSDNDCGGIDIYEIRWQDANGNILVESDSTNLPKYTPQSPVSEGIYKLSLRSKDTFGRPAPEWSDVFILKYDITSPTATLFINNGAETTAQTRVLLAPNASDNLSGVSDIRISNDSTTLNSSAWLSYTNVMTWVIPALDHYTHTVYAQTRDWAGNLSSVLSDTIYLDFNSPPPHTTNYRICQDVLVAGGSVTANSTSYSLISTLAEALANGKNASHSANFIIESGLLANTTGCLPITTPPPPTDYRIKQSILDTGGDLRVNVNYQLKDSLGEPVVSNQNALSSNNYHISSGFWARISGMPSDQFAPLTTLETQLAKPSIQNFNLTTSNAADIPQFDNFKITINSDNPYTNSPLVTVQAEAPNISQIRLSKNSTYVDEGWQTYQITHTILLSTSEILVVPGYIYAWFRDEKGLIYGTYFDEITYDIIPPEGYVNLLGTDVEDAPLLFELEAWDENSGVANVRISESPNFDDAIWQPYTEVLEWNLAGDTVYIQFRDRAGNVSETYSQNFVSIPDDTTSGEIYLPIILKN